MSRMANRKPGIALPTMTTPDDQTSKRDPSRTALAMPSGIDIRYTSSVVHSPSEIETGIFSSTRSTTVRSWKKLSPKSKRT